MKAVILAGGKGTRLAPYTKVLPKPLMPIGEMPILEVLLLQLKRAGVKDVTLAVGHLASLLKAFFQDGSQYEIDIHYCFEDFPLGTAGPLASVQGLDDDFLVANGDILTDLNLRDLVKFHTENQAAATIAMHNRSVKIDLGVIECGENNHVSGYIEKPTIHYKVSMGIYVFHPRVLSYIPSQQRLDFPDLIQKLLAAGEKVIGYPFEGYWQDLGRPDDYEQATLDFESLRYRFLPED